MLIQQKQGEGELLETQPKETIDTVLKKTIATGINAIFQQYGIHFTESSENKKCYDIVAVIGFSGDYKGAVGFAAEKPLVKAAFGETNTTLSDSWVGEVSNQLLGRLKNALLAYGIEIQIALPMVLNGVKIQVRSVNSAPFQSVHQSEAGDACIWVDSNWDIQQELERLETEFHAKPEGNTFIF